MKKIIFAMLILLLTFCLPTYAENLYVSPTGAGAKNGSESDPWDVDGFNTASNWGAGAGKISAGDTVILENGTYTKGSVYPTAVLRARGGGTSGNEIMITARNKWQAIIDGANNTAFCVYASTEYDPSVNYIIWKDLKLMRAKYMFRILGEACEGAECEDSCVEIHHHTITGCWLYNSTIQAQAVPAASGIAWGVTAHDMIVEKCVFEDLGYDYSVYGKCGSFAIYGCGYNHIVQNNIFLPLKDGGKNHYRLGGHCHPTTRQDYGEIVNNLFISDDNSECPRASIVFSWAHGNKWPLDPVIANNIMYNPGYGLGGSETTYAIQSYVHKTKAPDSGTLIYNNVTDAEEIYMEWCVPNGSPSCPLAPGIQPTFSGNKTSVDGVTITNLAAQFTNFAGGDYSLKGLRPTPEWLVDLGWATHTPPTDCLGITRPQGSADDIGPYELKQPIVTVTAPDASAAEEGQATGYWRISGNIAFTGQVISFTYTGNAILNTDYDTALSPPGENVEDGNVTISSGTSIDIYLTPRDDSEQDISEVGILTIIDGVGYSVGSPYIANIVIEDNDGAQDAGVAGMGGIGAGPGKVTYDSSGSGSWTR